MVMRPEPWGEALDAVLGAGAERHRPGWSCPRPAGAPFTQALAARAGRASRGWSSPAAATRASTSGCSTTPRDRLPRRRGLARRLRARRRRGRRAGDRRGGRPAAARRARQRRVARRRVARTGVRGPARVARLHQAGRPGAAATVPAGAALRRPRAIARWRRDESLRRTARRRPDLLAALDPAALDRARPAPCSPSWAGSAGARRLDWSASAPPVADSRPLPSSRPRPCHRGGRHLARTGRRPTQLHPTTVGDLWHRER